MKYSYYQNKKQPPVGEVTDEEVVNIIRHDEKLAHMTLDSISLPMTSQPLIS